MNFVLIDDIEQHNETLAAKVIALCEKKGWHGCISLKTTDTQAVADYAAACTEPTVYFMAVELGRNETTLPLHSVIQQSKARNYIVYVSAHAQYAMECLHTHAFDFLMKPLSVAQLEGCLSAIMKDPSREEKQHFLQVHTGSRTIMADPARILYFSRDRMIVRLHAQDGSTLEWRESFDHLLTRLNTQQFFLCHRSYVINLRQIRHIDWDKDRIYLSDHTAIPISRRRATQLKAALKQLENTAVPACAGYPGVPS